MENLFNIINEVIQNQGWLAFPLCFAGGIVSSASPCVLAMIPLIIGYVGGYAGGSTRKAVYYSLFFTLGLTLTFTILGIIAGAMGRLFGDAGSFWKYILPPVVIILGIYLFFSDKIAFSPGLSGRFMPKEKALLGAFLMGLFFGILASPCATPVLAVILTFAAVKQDLVYSGGLLLFYAMGHWVLVLGAGISAGFAQKVLASRGLSNFSTYSKKAAGILLAGVGIYFIILYFL